MKKRTVICLLAAFSMLIIPLFSACKKDDNNDRRPPLKVWVYSEEFGEQLMRAFETDFPSIGWMPEITVVDPSELDAKLSDAISEKNAPDVFMLSPDNLSQYVDSDITLDVSEIGIELSESSYYGGVIDAATDDSGALKALCWQPDPGLFFYRRSIAKAYLGTDEPEEIGELLSDWKGFYDTAKRIRSQSKGSTAMIVGIEELMRAYMSSDNDGWVKDGKLNFGKTASEFIDLAADMAADELIYDAEQWSPAWIAGISDPQSVFGYFSSGMGMKNILKKACGGTIVGEGSFGDWGCVVGPSSYNWGGCWLAVYSDSDMRSQAATLLQHFICEEEAMQRNCLVDGSFSSSRTVVDTIKYDTQFCDNFLNGQNCYAMQAKAASNMSLSGVSKYSLVLDRAYLECVRGVAFDHKDKETAVSDFLKTAQAAYPELF